MWPRRGIGRCVPVTLRRPAENSPRLWHLPSGPGAWPAAPETLGPGDPRLFPKHLRPCQRLELGFPKAAWALLTHTPMLEHTHTLGLTLVREHTHAHARPGPNTHA